uniref:Uncharacterized protein n=1 Tax=Anopheles coluzzii TaxID=1518534 RepID=A0A8W7P0Z2_ANOCL
MGLMGFVESFREVFVIWVSWFVVWEYVEHEGERCIQCVADAALGNNLMHLQPRTVLGLEAVDGDILENIHARGQPAVGEKVRQIAQLGGRHTDKRLDKVGKVAPMTINR